MSQEVLQEVPPEVPRNCLETTKKNQVCCICKSGKIVFEPREKETLTLYGRNGIRQVLHKVYRCNNRNGEGCRAGFFHGYISYKGHRIYETDAIEHEVLVTSEQSGFEVEYLIEVKDRIQVCHTAFEAEAKVYNRFHNRTIATDTLQKRADLNRKRLTYAWKIFTHLEFGSRYGIENYQVIRNEDLDKTILHHDEAYDEAFEERWTLGHKCEVAGCDTVLVLDGACKPHRPVCAAKLSGVKVRSSFSTPSFPLVFSSCSDFCSPGVRSSRCEFPCGLLQHSYEEQQVLSRTREL